MPFVNEYISPEDAEKYRLKDIDAKLIGGNKSRDWTIDRERGIYLRNVSMGRDVDTKHESLWTLYWKGAELALRLDIVAASGIPGGAASTHWRLMQLNGTRGLPAELKNQQQQILADLKEALRAYKDNGVLSKSDEFDMTFDTDRDLVL